MKRFLQHTLAGLVFSAAVISPAPLTAQLPIPRFEIAGGISRFNLSGSGTTPFGALRVDLPLTSLILEGSLGAFRPTEQIGQHTYIIPEGQLQFQFFPALIRPYVGVGGGWMRAITGPDPRLNEMTLSASAGVRLGLPMLPFSVRGEVRVRGIGSGFNSSASEWTIGLSR